MKSYEEHFVAFLDILGFKEIINTTEFKKVQEIFSSIITRDDAIERLSRAVNPDVSDKESKVFLQYNESLSNTKVYIVSDSNVIVTFCNVNTVL